MRFGVDRGEQIAESRKLNPERRKPQIQQESDLGTVELSRCFHSLLHNISENSKRRSRGGKPKMNFPCKNSWQVLKRYVKI